MKKNPKILRILPQEISKKAILHEIANPTQIDQNKYDSQQARRVLDRLVGYKISPILWEKIKRGLSAGRVQSVALRLIVDREKAIAAYKKIEYWKIFANLETQKKEALTAQLVRDGRQTIYADSATVEKNHPRGVIQNGEEAQRYVERSKGAPFIVSEVDTERPRRFRRRICCVARRASSGFRRRRRRESRRRCSNRSILPMAPSV